VAAWYGGLDGTAVPFKTAYHTVIGICHRVTYTRGSIDTIDPLGDGHFVARNIKRIGINKYKKKKPCVKLVIYKDSPKFAFLFFQIESRGEKF